MNLYLRLLWLLITARFRGPLLPPFGVSSLNFRVWPHDIDSNLHLNNGRYFTIADLGRMDLMLRTNLLRTAVKRGWMPMLSGSIIRYRREIRTFRAFELQTRIVSWNDRNFVMEHRFIAEHNGKKDTAAVALVRGGLYNRAERRFISPTEIFEVMGYSGPSPDPSPDVAAFMAAEDEMKRQAGASVPGI